VHDLHVAHSEIDQPNAGLPCATTSGAMSYWLLAWFHDRASCRTYANNDRPRPDDGVVANRHTSLNDDTVTNVNVLANYDLLRDFSAIFAF
jgi:hypothetical protein